MQDSGLQQQGGVEGSRRSIHSRKAAAALPQCTTNKLYCNPPSLYHLSWVLQKVIWNHMNKDHPPFPRSIPILMSVMHDSKCWKWMVSDNTLLYPLNPQLWHIHHPRPLDQSDIVRAEASTVERSSTIKMWMG